MSFFYGFQSWKIRHNSDTKIIFPAGTCWIFFNLKKLFYRHFLVYQTFSAYLVSNSSSSLVLWSYNLKDAFFDKNRLTIYTHHRWCLNHMLLNLKRYYFASELQNWYLRVSELIKINILSYLIIKLINKQKNGRQTLFFQN